VYGFLASFFLMALAPAEMQETGAHQTIEGSIWLETGKYMAGEPDGAVGVTKAPAQATLSAQTRSARGQPRISTTRCALVVCSEPCQIVGSKNDRGELIYRMPDDPTYRRMRGEAIFCDQAEAKAAGYQPPQQS
jgi:hypothetical protein